MASGRPGTLRGPIWTKKLMVNYSSSSFFDQKHVQSKKLIRMYSSSSFFVQTRLRTRSSSFLVQVAPQRVPGHPEAKSGQNLIRNGLLEAILEASRPASKPASQAQPLGRVFSTKRVRGQNRRVFSCSRVGSSSFFARVSDRRVFSCSRATGDQIVEFSRAQGPDRRVVSCSRARSSSFLMLTGQIVEFSRRSGSQKGP